MLNGLWLGLFCLALVSAAWGGRLPDVAAASMKSATDAAELSLHLLGPMAMWLGLVRVLHEGRWLEALTKPFARLFAWLLPEVPSGHPALGLMTINMASNVLGLGNAATPFGLKAMRALQGLNANKTHASDAMVLFLVLNTSGLAVLPTGMVVLRASLGSQSPGAIFLPTIAATLTAAVVGLAAAKLLARSAWYAAKPAIPPEGGSADGPPAAEPADEPAAKKASPLCSPRQPWLTWSVGAALFAALAIALLGPALSPSVGQAPLQGAEPIEPVRAGLAAVWLASKHMVTQWSLLVLMAAIVYLGVARGVRVYDAIVAGGKEAFEVAIGVLPFLVVMLTVIGMLRAAGAIDAMTAALGPYTAAIGLPAAAVPMVLLRPLSGMGSYAVAADIMAREGPDSLAGLIASTLMGTTETTFYVLALYLGSVGIREGRHALAACLVADVAGTAMAIATCHLLLP